MSSLAVSKFGVVSCSPLELPSLPGPRVFGTLSKVSIPWPLGEGSGQRDPPTPCNSQGAIPCIQFPSWRLLQLSVFLLGHFSRCETPSASTTFWSQQCWTSGLRWVSAGGGDRPVWGCPRLFWLPSSVVYPPTASWSEQAPAATIAELTKSACKEPHQENIWKQHITCLPPPGFGTQNHRACERTASQEWGFFVWQTDYSGRRGVICKPPSASERRTVVQPFLSVGRMA